jgi:hypothetical protein
LIGHRGRPERGASIDEHFGGDALPKMTLSETVREKTHTRPAHDVDEAGRHHPSARIDSIRCVAISQIPNRNDPVTADADVSGTRFRAGAVDHHSAGYHEVEFWSGGTGSEADCCDDDQHEQAGGSTHDLVLGRIRRFHEGSF